MKFNNYVGTIVCLAMFSQFMVSCSKGSVKENEEGIKLYDEQLIKLK